MRSLLNYPNRKAGAVINPCRFVKFGSTEEFLVQGAAATDLIFGVSPEKITYQQNDVIAPALIGVVKIQCGNTVVAGDRLTTDSVGRAIPAVGTARVGAIALQGGVTNDIIEAVLYPSNIEGIAGITASAAQINLLDNNAAPAYHKIPRVVKKALNAVDTAGGVFNHTFGVAVIVSRVIVDITTASTGSCTINIGTAATATTSGDNLINALSVAATGIFDNINNAGTNGRARQKLSSTEFVTGSVASGASSGLVGNAYIEFFEV